MLGDLLSFQFSFCVSGAILISILSLSGRQCVSFDQTSEGGRSWVWDEPVTDDVGEGWEKGKLTQVIDIHHTRIT